MNRLVNLRALKLSCVASQCGNYLKRNVHIAALAKPSAKWYPAVSESRPLNIVCFFVKQVGRRREIRSISNSSQSAVIIPSYKKHDHSFIWAWERAITVVLLGTMSYAMYQWSDAAEYVITLFVALHTHWGLEAICTDYLRPAVVGNFIPKCIRIIVFIPVSFTMYGMANSTLSGRGIFHVIQQFWQLKTTEQLKNSKAVSP